MGGGRASGAAAAAVAASITAALAGGWGAAHRVSDEGYLTPLRCGGEGETGLHNPNDSFTWQPYTADGHAEKRATFERLRVRLLEHGSWGTPQALPRKLLCVFFLLFFFAPLHLPCFNMSRSRKFRSDFAAAGEAKDRGDSRSAILSLSFNALSRSASMSSAYRGPLTSAR